MTTSRAAASSANDPIRKVSVVSTGTVQIRPEHVGPTDQNMYMWLLVTARQWTAPRPINSYVIEHREGLVLFDTGQDIASVTDPNYFPSFPPTRYLYDRLAKFAIAPHEALPARLRKLGHNIKDVHTAVISHLHQDHIGGLPDLRSGTNIMITEHEWQDMLKPMPAPRGFLRSHIQLPGLQWRRIQPEPLGDPSIAPFHTGHDIFGDGSLTLVPTPGHTGGSVSLLVRRPGRPVLLMVGDLTYDANLLAAGKVPGVGDKRAMQTSVAAVNTLRQRYPDLVVLPAHDPGAAARLAAAENTPAIS